MKLQFRDGTGSYVRGIEAVEYLGTGVTIIVLGFNVISDKASRNTQAVSAFEILNKECFVFFGTLSVPKFYFVKGTVCVISSDFLFKAQSISKFQTILESRENIDENPFKKFKHTI